MKSLITRRTGLALAFLMLGGGLAAAQNHTYTAVDLGALRGGSAVPRMVSAAGTVVGRSGEPHGESTQAFMWNGGHPIGLGFLPGGDYSAAFGVNSAGQVVGYSNTATALRGFVWTAATGMQDLGALPGDVGSEAFGVNTAGQVVGESSGAAGTQAILRTSGGIQNLGTLPGDDESIAYAINDSGQVVGYSGGGGHQRAFLWSAATGMQELGTLPGQSDSVANFINNNGQVVGSSGSAAFIWSAATGMQDLGFLPGGDYSQAYGINNAGQIVGASGSDLGTRAFIWDAQNGMQDLNGLINNPNLVLAGATGINDNGQIVAFGIIASHTMRVDLDHDSHAGPLHMFLLKPH